MYINPVVPSSPVRVAMLMRHEASPAGREAQSGSGRGRGAGNCTGFNTDSAEVGPAGIEIKCGRFELIRGRKILLAPDATFPQDSRNRAALAEAARQ